MRWVCSVLLFALASAPLVAEEAPSVLPPPTHADVAYGEDARHRLDLWKTEAEGATPLLIFVHGGGWAGGDKRDLPPTLVRELLDAGISVASVNYRYSTIAPLPAPVHDAARAVQFLRARSVEWGLDPERFGGYGISAGGCTVLWLATHRDLADATSPDPVARSSSRLQATVAMSPQVSLEPALLVDWVGEKVLVHPMISRAIGARSLAELMMPSEESRLLLEGFSPIRHLDAGDPPILISHPRIDPLPAASAGSAIHHAVFGTKFTEAATAAGVTCIHRLQDAPDKTPTPERFLIDRLTR